MLLIHVLWALSEHIKSTEATQPEYTENSSNFSTNQKAATLKQNTKKKMREKNRNYKKWLHKCLARVQPKLNSLRYTGNSFQPGDIFTNKPMRSTVRSLVKEYLRSQRGAGGEHAQWKCYLLMIFFNLFFFIAERLHFQITLNRR